MDLQLTNKVALVTGSTAGIGFAIGAGLAAEGAKVIINGRSETRVDEAIAMIRQKHPQARLAACAGDLSDAEAAQRVTNDFPTRSTFWSTTLASTTPSLSKRSRITNGTKLLKPIS
jgi:NAD(P)-dependent dehydrogenase (short-subunit alcohol dehydrogenase family)